MSIYFAGPFVFQSDLAVVFDPPHVRHHWSRFSQFLAFGGSLTWISRPQPGQAVLCMASSLTRPI
jgi:hypothetical protein